MRAQCHHPVTEFALFLIIVELESSSMSFSFFFLFVEGWLTCSSCNAAFLPLGGNVSLLCALSSLLIGNAMAHHGLVSFTCPSIQTH